MCDLEVVVEETHGIKISESDWQSFVTQKPVTAGMLADFIFSKIPLSERADDEDVTPTTAVAPLLRATALYWLKQEICRHTAKENSDSAELAAGTELSRCMTRWQIRSLFQKWRVAGMQSPHLWVSRQATLLIAATCGLLAMTTLVTLAAFSAEFNISEASFVVFMHLILCLVILAACKRWLAATPSTKTVQQLSRHLLELNPRFFGRLAGVKVRRKEVWQFVRRTLIDTGVDPDEVTPEARLIEDLQME